ncbi:MAG: ABC transporter permease [Beutenbergiaceae bacterium]
MKQASERILTWLKGPIPLSVVLAFVVSAVFIVIAGYSPLTAYRAMIEGSLLTPLGVGNTLQRAVPLIGMAMATAIAFRSGVLNIGTEGQMVIGGLTGVLVALFMPGPPALVMVVALIAGFAGGALWGLVSAVLQFWPGVPILISSLLLSYPARYFASWMTRFQLKDPDSSQVATNPIPEGTQVPPLVPRDSGLGQTLSETFGSRSFLTTVLTGANWGLVMVIVIVIAVAFMNKRTAFGYELRVHGANPDFVRYGGVNSRRRVLQTMALSGGIAGLVGTLLVIGAPNTRFIDGALVGTNYAWTGLLVALLALYRPGSVLIAGLFFAAITAGSGEMSRVLGMSPQIAAVVQGIMIILIAFQIAWPRFKSRRRDTSPVPADAAGGDS